MVIAHERYSLRCYPLSITVDGEQWYPFFPGVWSWWERSCRCSVAQPGSVAAAFDEVTVTPPSSDRLLVEGQPWGCHGSMWNVLIFFTLPTTVVILAWAGLNLVFESGTNVLILGRTGWAYLSVASCCRVLIAIIPMRTGSGKSSLLRVLKRLWPPLKGLNSTVSLTWLAT